jgi:hypothetical protein
MGHSNRNVLDIMQEVRYITLVSLCILVCFSYASPHIAASSPVIVSRGESFQLSATLLMNVTYGAPIPSQSLEFYDQTNDQFLGMSMTDEDGIATLQYAFPKSHPLGYTLINATFRGNDTLSLAPSCQWITLLITSLTSINITAQNTILAPDDQLTFTVSLLDDTQNPIPNATVSVYHDSVFLQTTTTNSIGQALIHIDLQAQPLPLGNHSIEVVYTGNQSCYYRGVSDSFNIQIRKEQTSIISCNNVGFLLLNHTSVITMRLTSEKDIMQGFPIDLTIADSNFHIQEVTNDTGYASFEIHVDNRFVVGAHLITAAYLGNIRYNESLIQLPCYINTSLVVGHIYSGQVQLNRNTTISLNVTDIYSRPIPSILVSLTDETTKYSMVQTFINESQVIFRVPILGEVGNRTFSVIISGEYCISSEHISFILGVWDRPRIELKSANILGFASPSQPIDLVVHVSNYIGNLSHRQITLSILGLESSQSSFTDKSGVALVSIQSPDVVGAYLFTIRFAGNKSLFEMSSSYNFTVHVELEIPVRISDFQYTINPILKSVVVTIKVQVLNGSFLGGIKFRLSWLNTIATSSTQAGGLMKIDLLLPDAPGMYELEYETSPTTGISASSGILYVIISPSDSNISEGLGFYPLLVAISSSVLLLIFPIFRRRSIIS